jgi:hypothetical protein
MYSFFLSDFNEASIVLTYFRRLLMYQISLKYVQWEPSCSMRTDRHDEDDTRFSQFCERTQRQGLLFQITKRTWRYEQYLKAKSWYWTCQGFDSSKQERQPIIRRETAVCPDNAQLSRSTCSVARTTAPTKHGGRDKWASWRGVSHIWRGGDNRVWISQRHQCFSYRSTPSYDQQPVEGSGRGLTCNPITSFNLLKPSGNFTYRQV